MSLPRRSQSHFFPLPRPIFICLGTDDDDDGGLDGFSLCHLSGHAETVDRERKRKKLCDVIKIAVCVRVWCCDGMVRERSKLKTIYKRPRHERDAPERERGKSEMSLLPIMRFSDRTIRPTTIISRLISLVLHLPKTKAGERKRRKVFHHDVS